MQCNRCQQGTPCIHPIRTRSRRGIPGVGGGVAAFWCMWTLGAGAQRIFFAGRIRMHARGCRHITCACIRAGTRISREKGQKKTGKTEDTRRQSMGSLSGARNMINIGLTCVANKSLTKCPHIEIRYGSSRLTWQTMRCPPRKSRRPRHPSSNLAPEKLSQKLSLVRRRREVARVVGRAEG